MDMITKLPGFVADAALGSSNLFYSAALPIRKKGKEGAQDEISPQFLQYRTIVLRDDGAVCICYEDEDLRQSVCDCERP